MQLSVASIVVSNQNIDVQLSDHIDASSGSRWLLRIQNRYYAVPI